MLRGETTALIFFPSNVYAYKARIIYPSTHFYRGTKSAVANKSLNY